MVVLVYTGPQGVYVFVAGAPVTLNVFVSHIDRPTDGNSTIDALHTPQMTTLN